jgi:hypothetical protein
MQWRCRLLDRCMHVYQWQKPFSCMVKTYYLSLTAAEVSRYMYYVTYICQKEI